MDFFGTLFPVLFLLIFFGVPLGCLVCCIVFGVTARQRRTWNREHPDQMQKNANGFRAAAIALGVVGSVLIVLEIALISVFAVGMAHM